MVERYYRLLHSQLLTTRGLGCHRRRGGDGGGSYRSEEFAVLQAATAVEHGSSLWMSKQHKKSGWYSNLSVTMHGIPCDIIAGGPGGGGAQIGRASCRERVCQYV